MISGKLCVQDPFGNHVPPIKVRNLAELLRVPTNLSHSKNSHWSQSCTQYHAVVSSDNPEKGCA